MSSSPLKPPGEHASLRAPAHDESPQFVWLPPHLDTARAEAFGIRLTGGGTHQAKTMMLQDIVTYLSDPEASPETARTRVIEVNALSKNTRSARQIAFRHLNALYALEANPPLTRTLTALWKRDAEARRMVALLSALARDPLLRDSAEAVLPAPVGLAVRWPVIAEVYAHKYPERLSPKMLKSLSQNCASTWTQSGHLSGAVRKQRIRATATPVAAAYAALIASECGFGGPSLLDSPWMRVLDVSRDRALDLLRQAEALGLARVRSAGDVLEISVRHAMSAALGI